MVQFLGSLFYSSNAHIWEVKQCQQRKEEKNLLTDFLSQDFKYLLGMNFCFKKIFFGFLTWSTYSTSSCEFCKIIISVWNVNFDTKYRTNSNDTYLIIML